MARKFKLRKSLIDEAFFDYVCYPVRGKCPVMFCSNLSGRDRSLCDKHRMQKWRGQNPARSAYLALRDHAKAKGKVFTITFDDFMAIARDFPFNSAKPEQYKDYLSIDRIDSRKGYEPGNIQALTVSENSRKSNRLDYTAEGRYWHDQAEAAEAEQGEGPVQGPPTEPSPADQAEETAPGPQADTDFEDFIS